MDQTFEKRKKVIYDFICDDFYIPMKVKEIATVLQVSKEQRRDLQEVLDAEKNPFRYALFVSFFPQLVQGPISRWNDLKKSLLESHAFSWINIQYGFERILWGYFKKMVIADRAAIGLATIQSDVSVYYGAYAFVGMLLYAIDLYADFTGGIDNP